MSDSPMMIAALYYAETYGWKVFPCQPRTKIPFPGTRGVKDATSDPALIRAYWTRWPDANIALACGPGSNLAVVDVDNDPEKGINGWESLAKLPALPETVKQLSPRGGAHFIYLLTRPVRNKNSFKPGIDIRSEGYYIMLSPSVHPNGKLYVWDNDHAPGEIELAEFPEHMMPEERAIPPWEKEAVPVTTTPSVPVTSPHAMAVVERARLYLQECEPAVQGQAGHDKLLWAARAMVVGFDLDEATALSLLWTDFNPRCVPPWNRQAPGEIKDFERKVAEARRTPGERPRGWLLDENGLRHNDTAYDDYGRRLAAGLLARTQSEAIDKPSPDDEDRPEIIRNTLKKHASTMPEYLLHPPGLVGEIVEWINTTAGCKQPMLALGASLVACGSLFGRKVRDESNGRTNLYIMGVAHSSSGKDHPADCIERLFARSGASGILGGNRVTSDTAIELSLQACPTVLYCWDEVGHMLGAIKAAGVGSGSGQHLRTIVPALMQLYSSSHKIYVGKQRAEGEARRIDQPHVCVWALTSPDVLYAGLSTAELRDGWLGRVITIISHDRPKYHIVRHSPPPDSLVTMVKAWLTRVIPPPEGEGDIAGSTGCYQIEIPTQPSAMMVLESFRDECYERMLRCDAVGDDVQFLWGKALQNARRIALTLASGDRFEGQEITEYHARYACDFVRHTVENFGLSVKLNVADNEWEAEKMAMVRLLTKAGPDGMSKMEITRRTQRIRDRKVRDAYITDLVEAGIVVFGNNPEHPEARSGWLWKAPHGLDVVSKKEKN
jgi:hypothetical protein